MTGGHTTNYSDFSFLIIPIGEVVSVMLTIMYIIVWEFRIEKQGMYTDVVAK